LQDSQLLRALVSLYLHSRAAVFLCFFFPLLLNVMTLFQTVAELHRDKAGAGRSSLRGRRTPSRRSPAQPQPSAPIGVPGKTVVERATSSTISMLVGGRYSFGAKRPPRAAAATRIQRFAVRMALFFAVPWAFSCCMHVLYVNSGG
jgi:hypothetical protein